VNGAEGSRSADQLPSEGAHGLLSHAYGSRVRVLSNPLLDSLVARLCEPRTKLREITSGLRFVYEALTLEASRDFPRCRREIATRMAEQHPEAGILRGEFLDPAMRVVIVDVVRAGILPSQVCFERLASVLPDECLRLDHLTMARIADASGHVARVDLSGSKIGGTVAGATLIVPDPMGATGSTLIRAVEHYREHHGVPARVIALSMIVTPEFLRRSLDLVENLTIIAARLDRGLSPPDVLATPPGTHWARERGLDEHDYIVPGAGGMGELLNNSWC
jgi:uracil phosphoribosyltransferase